MKAIVLDMYGVIVKQTGEDFVPFVQQTFPDIKPEEIYIPWFKADIGELTSLEVWEAIGFQGDLEQIEKTYLDTMELNDDLIEFIQEVRKHYKLAIISNDSSRWSKYLREKFDLNQYFDVISISGDLRIQKPDERIFQLTIEKLGVKAEDCWYIDDREGNLEAAKKVGMNPILMNSRNVSYEGAIVNDFKELKKYCDRNISAEKDELYDVYEVCPQFENDKYLLRFLSKNDAVDLLKVYSDPKSVSLCNSDGCFGDFYFTSVELMQSVIEAWQVEYQRKNFIRWSIIDKCINKAIGTIELFHRDSKDYFTKCGLLRLDLRSDYENASEIEAILSLIVPKSFEMFQCDKVATKAIAKAHERRTALMKMNFVLSNEQLIGNDGRRYDDYFVLSV